MLLLCRTHSNCIALPNKTTKWRYRTIMLIFTRLLYYILMAQRADAELGLRQGVREKEREKETGYFENIILSESESYLIVH